MKKFLIKSFSFSLIFFGVGFLIFLVSKAWFDNGSTSDGESLTADRWNQMEWTKPPVGSIIAWHGDMTNTPSLPQGWVECNGQTLNDSESVYNGQIIPDLNSQVYAGGRGRYLRGGETTGLFNESTYYGHNGAKYGASNGIRYGAAYGMYFNGEQGNSLSYGSLSDFRTPHFQVTAMTVKWIMRIK